MPCTGSMKGVREYGMPQFRHPELKGNLYIKFEILFPASGFLADEADMQVHVHVCSHGMCYMYMYSTCI